MAGILPNDPVEATELADGDDQTVADHGVPADLLELHEVLEWRAAAEVADGVEGNPS